MDKFLSVLLICTFGIFCLCFPHTFAENCEENLIKLREEYNEFKLQKEKESQQFHSKITQLTSEIESLKTNSVPQESNEFWKNSLDTILNAIENRNGDEIKALVRSRSSHQADSSQNHGSKELIKEYGICQYSLSTCVSENRALNHSLAQVINDKSLLQTEIAELKSASKKFSDDLGICQSSLSSCVSENEKLIVDLNSWTICQVRATSTCDDQVAAVVDVRLNTESNWDDAIFNGSIFLTNSTWTTSICSKSTFVSNGWYDSDCKLVWPYDRNADVDIKQYGERQFHLKLGNPLDDDHIDKLLLEELKSAHSAVTKSLAKQIHVCESTVSFYQAEITRLKLAHTVEIINLTKIVGICQSSLASCFSENANLSSSLAVENSWTECKIQRIPSLSSDIIKASVDVRISSNDSNDGIFNNARFLTNSTWQSSECWKSVFVGNGWYDEDCKLVWRFYDKITATMSQNTKEHFKLQLLNQISEETSQKFSNSPKDCSEILLSRQTESGVYNIYPDGYAVQVYCDMETDGGGWTVVLQRGKRGSQRADFYRNWTQYERGFGDVFGGDYNIGLKNLRILTSLHDKELRVDLSDWKGNSAYAIYKTFWIGGANEKYKLMIGNYSGDAGDSLAYQNGQKFSTFDQDNDSHGANCAVEYSGAWWYNDCHYSSLNGKYFNLETMDAKGVNWYYWKNNYLSMKTAEMKIRRLNFDTLRRSLI